MTGAGGFIGSHLVEELLRRGHKVRASSATPPPAAPGFSSRFRPACASDLEIFLGDIRDARAVREAARGAGASTTWRP